MAATHDAPRKTLDGPGPDVAEPFKTRCEDCGEVVIVAYVKGLRQRLRVNRVVADPFEWEPRAACPYCGHVEGRGHTRGQCPRCGSSGYIGEDRPAEMALAIDMAWSDEGGMRLIGPKTPRRRGEALYPLHVC